MPWSEGQTHLREDKGFLIVNVSFGFYSFGCGATVS